MNCILSEAGGLGNPTATPRYTRPNSNTGGSRSQQPTAGSSAQPQAGTLSIDVAPNAGTSAGGTGGIMSCATQQADADVERMPVDIIVTIDNSGSMQEEIDAVENNINTKFASILQTSGVDYRVILLSRHEKKGRQTSICVLPPLSANNACPPTPDQPAFTERFYQYSLKVDSLNSLSLLVDTFMAKLLVDTSELHRTSRSCQPPRTRQPSSGRMLDSRRRSIPSGEIV